nr:unnamed protein product [Naegleria fowleri]
MSTRHRRCYSSFYSLSPPTTHKDYELGEDDRFQQLPQQQQSGILEENHLLVPNHPLAYLSDQHFKDIFDIQESVGMNKQAITSLSSVHGNGGMDPSSNINNRMIHLRRSSSSLFFSSSLLFDDDSRGDDEEEASSLTSIDLNEENHEECASSSSVDTSSDEAASSLNLHHPQPQQHEHTSTTTTTSESHSVPSLNRKLHQKSYSFSILNVFGTNHDYNDDIPKIPSHDTESKPHHTIHPDNNTNPPQEMHKDKSQQDFSTSTFSFNFDQNSKNSKSNSPSLLTSPQNSQDKFLVWWFAFFILLILLVAISFGLMTAIPEIKRKRIENTPYWDETLKAKEEKRKLAMQHGMWHNLTAVVLEAMNVRSRGGPSASSSSSTKTTSSHTKQSPGVSPSNAISLPSGIRPSPSNLSFSDRQMEHLTLRMRGLIANALKKSSQQQEQVSAPPAPHMTSFKSHAASRIAIIDEYRNADKEDEENIITDRDPKKLPFKKQQHDTSSQSNQESHDSWENLDYPFLDSNDIIEKQYFTNHILLSHDLNPFYIVNSSALTSWKDSYKTLHLKFATEGFAPSLRPIDEKFEDTFFRKILIREKSIYSRMSNSQLKSQFFGLSLKRRIANSKFVDWRANQLLYEIDRTHENDGSFRYHVTTKRASLKVHVKFNDVKYRDDFLEYPRVTEKSRERYCKNNFCGTDAHEDMTKLHSNTHNASNLSNTHNLCVMCEANIPKSQSSHFYKGLCYKPNVDLAIVSIENGILDYGLHDPSKVFAIFDSDGNLFAQDPISTTRTVSTQDSKFRNYNIEYHAQLASIGPIQISSSPSQPDNFFIEIVPRLLLLDSFLPLEIPIILHEGIGIEKIDLMQQFGMISPVRQFLFVSTSGVPTFHMAQRLYFLYSKDVSVVPRTPDIALRVASNVMNKALQQWTSLRKDHQTRQQPHNAATTKTEKATSSKLKETEISTEEISQMHKPSTMMEHVLFSSQKSYILVVEKESSIINVDDDSTTGYHLDSSKIHNFSNRKEFFSTLLEFCNSKGLQLVHLKIPSLRNDTMNLTLFSSIHHGDVQPQQQQFNLSFIELGRLFHHAHGVISLFDFPLSHYLLFMKSSSSSSSASQSPPPHAVNILEIGSRETLNHENYCVARALGLEYNANVVTSSVEREDEILYRIDVEEMIQIVSTF